MLSWGVEEVVTLSLEVLINRRSKYRNIFSKYNTSMWLVKQFFYTGVYSELSRIQLFQFNFSTLAYKVRGLLWISMCIIYKITCGFKYCSCTLMCMLFVQKNVEIRVDVGLRYIYCFVSYVVLVLYLNNFWFVLCKLDRGLNSKHCILCGFYLGVWLEFLVLYIGVVSYYVF